MLRHLVAFAAFASSAPGFELSNACDSYQTPCAGDATAAADDRIGQLAATALLQGETKLLSSGQKAVDVVPVPEPDPEEVANYTKLLVVPENGGWTDTDLSWAQNDCTPGRRLIFAGIVTAPVNSIRRDLTRKAWLNALRKADIEPNCISVKFIIGHQMISSDEDPSQALADEEQLKLERLLQAEQDKNGDILRLPFPEAYQNLPDKTIALLNYGQKQGYEFILKVDDDWLPNWYHVLNRIRDKKSSDFVYAGFNFWEHRVNPRIQKGADEDFRPYFSGALYMVSNSLAEQITIKGLQETSRYLTYGSTSEDFTLGRWVDLASQETGKKVDYAQNSWLCQRLCTEKVCPLKGYASQ